MPHLERSNVEAPFVAWLTGVHPAYLCIKLVKIAGLPDRLILGPNRFVLFLEFKRPSAPKKRRGEKLQRYFADMLKGFGFTYVKVDTKNSAIEAFESEMGRPVPTP